MLSFCVCYSAFLLQACLLLFALFLLPAANGASKEVGGLHQNVLHRINALLSFVCPFNFLDFP